MRNKADGHKKAVQRKLLHFSVLKILCFYAPEGRVAHQFLYHCGSENLHIGLFTQLCGQRCLTGEKIQVLYDIDPFGKVGKEQSLLQGGVPAADHGHRAVFVKCAVADCAKGNAVSDKIFFSRETQQPMPCACGHNDRAGGKLPVIGQHGFYCAVPDAGDGGGFNFRALGEHLINHFFGKFIAGERGKAGNVFYLGGVGNLPAEGFFFNDQHAFVGAPGVKGGGQPRR